MFVPPQFILDIVGVKISYKISPWVFLLVSSVLAPKWVCSAQTCRLVEISWWTCSQLGAVLVQGF